MRRAGNGTVGSNPTLSATLWYYKARFYRADIGRFLQTDPIGFEGGINFYAYVGNDPVNWTDPLGLQDCPNPDGDVLICGSRKHPCSFSMQGCRQYELGPFWGFGVIWDKFGGAFDRFRERSGGEAEREKEECTPTKEDLENSGAVTFAGVGLSAYGVLGWTNTTGAFRTQSGLTGTYNAFGLGIGAGVAYFATAGREHSLADFMGGADNIQINTPLGSATASRGMNSNSSWHLSSYSPPGSIPNSSIIKSILGPTAAILATSISGNFTVRNNFYKVSIEKCRE